MMKLKARSNYGLRILIILIFVSMLLMAIVLIFIFIRFGIPVMDTLGRFATIESIPHDLDTLFVNIEVFPDDWVLSTESPSSPCRASPLGSGCMTGRALQQSYSYTEFPGGGAFQSIYKHDDIKQASEDFERMESRYFSINEESDIVWTIPSELSFSSVSADRYRFGCDNRALDDSCQLLAQYQEYIVIFHTDRSRTYRPETYELLSYDELLEIFKSIDMIFSTRISDISTY